MMAIGRKENENHDYAELMPERSYKFAAGKAGSDAVRFLPKLRRYDAEDDINDERRDEKPDFLRRERGVVGDRPSEGKEREDFTGEREDPAYDRADAQTSDRFTVFRGKDSFRVRLRGFRSLFYGFRLSFSDCSRFLFSGFLGVGCFLCGRCLL